MQLNEKNIPASYKGPPENVHVPNYKKALATFAIPIKKEQWSKEERKNLVKGVKQQFQEMLLQRSVDLLGYGFSCSVRYILHGKVACLLICLNGIHSPNVFQDLIALSDP